MWSGRPGSNRPPRPWQGRALPNELLPHCTRTIWGCKNKGLPFFNKKFFDLFVLGHVLCVLGNSHLQPVVTLVKQASATAKQKCQQAKHREVKQKCRRRNPVVRKVPVLNFFQFFLILFLQFFFTVHTCFIVAQK